jgi:hypothetical protein
MVLFKDFYKEKINKLTRKEKLIFKWGGDSLRNSSAIIFSTDWQRKIFESAYKLNSNKNYIVENYCGERCDFIKPDNRSFVAGTRTLKWKNIDFLKQAFSQAATIAKQRNMPEIDLDCGKAVYDSFVEKLHHSYAVILVSLGDISPNMIFDAIRVGTPFILTKENGISERVKDCAIFVDPLDKNDIVDKILWLSDPKNRDIQANKIRAFNWVHSWKQIGNEIIKVWEKIK